MKELKEFIFNTTFFIFHIWKNKNEIKSIYKPFLSIFLILWIPIGFISSSLFVGLIWTYTWTMYIFCIKLKIWFKALKKKLPKFIK